ncbi:linoleate 13S-lipoxygenase 2-1, chloroplastic [Elaeis guineensis]|uniref:Lipoxygenase n=1 Tax=Elaeis guineensis var. tenera TaxID=51953 RepID=A0A6I9RLH7_ELAGV|nr:linoleate 13S-lipoxygenase 2-1, chloroplastic [Elaeis guineensis]
MLKPLLLASNQAPSLFFSFRSSSHGSSSTTTRTVSVRQRKASTCGRICCRMEEAQAVVTAAKSTVPVKAIVTVNLTIGGTFAHLSLNCRLDDITDLLGKSLFLELVSSELDPKTGLEKDAVGDYAHRAAQGKGEVKYEGNFMVPIDFGDIGAVLVTNEHHKEMHVKDIVLMIGDATALTINCQSWVHSKFDNPEKRIFFTNKSYLPSRTPSGLQRLRKKEQENLRGDGTGERKAFERIYDYDTYNDLGKPDKSEDLRRPVVGGSKEFPYPRRCRTGRPRSEKDPLSETRRSGVYIPRDEAFSEVKQLTFSAKTLRSVLHALIPSIGTAIVDTKLGFPYFAAIDSLFSEGMKLPKQEGLNFFSTVIPRLVKAIAEGTEDVLLFETPEMIIRDKFSWFRDEEFSRQTLAGVNPLSIQLVTELPIVSKLDPDVYGPPESAITEELIEREIKGVMTVLEALQQKRLFMLDYHDVLLPFVHKVRELGGTTLYGSRTLFFLTMDDTLRPIAIELTRPASPIKPQWKQVFTHCWDATGSWLWKLAKAHVCAHESGYHQLVSHWLRTHSCTEPYIIAANRQLGAMHPIYRLLHPHFRYTMEINALAREYLINAGGTIETSFSPRKYSMELSSVAYDKLWRFDMEALPADLIRRGMAVEDPTAEFGLRLTINDYPFANDGLLIWSAIKQWVTDYVKHYYPDTEHVVEDYELQEWWTEVRTKGHADKKDEPWWPVLNTPEDLIHVLTTIIWVASGHHAAVNFGQYHYAGYFPNRPTIARKNMPVEDPDSEDFAKFWENPEFSLLQCFPSQIQATAVMAVLDILSSHAPDEEYLGGEPEPAWVEEPVIKAAFERFHGRMKEIEGIIDERNANPKFKNRCSVGTVPYELLKPFSKPGVTGMGIPNSISI